MAAVNVLKFGVSSPADTSPLDQLKAAGYEPSQILGLVGKTEGMYGCLFQHVDPLANMKQGNGCVNDFSRTLSTVVWERLLSPEAVTVFSGGTEGVLSPHVTFIVKEKSQAETGLRAAVGRTRALEPDEIGTAEHARQVQETVAGMIESMGVTRDHIHLVLIKCPLLTSSKIEAIRTAGKTPITTDTYESMAKSRYASAVGIAAALGEISADALEPAVSATSADEQIWSAKASCSSGAELEDNHILVLASSPTPGGQLRAVSAYMADAIDATAILGLLARAKEDGGEVVQVFAKAEADPSGKVRGKRHTMTTDSDIHSTRHARAAVGGLIAGLTGDTQVYVSGGAEGQGPVGGGSLCLVYRLSG